jgi:signal transduction histidine kinase
MKRLWRDTLFKRLFILMWVALVVSHVLAFNIVTRFVLDMPSPPRGFHAALLLPSLPPTPGVPGGPTLGEGRGARAPRDAPGMPPDGAHDGEGNELHRMNRPPPVVDDDYEPDDGPRAFVLPTGALLLDYGVRFLIIGMAAWWGARWVSAPMRRLAAASRVLARSIGSHEPPPHLDESNGTVEVRDAAHVFNEMGRELDDQFRGRGLLVAALSHDLRTPLTRMRMRLESIESEAAQRCIADVREMNELIDSSLVLFRGVGHAEPAQRVDVLALAQSLCDDLAEQGHAVSVSGPATAVADAQPMALRRVLSNLISNALRYGERADVTVLQEPHAVTVTVDDAGPGIAPEQLEKVFQPFFRAETSRNRATGGTGLGLYIARDLIRRQSGTLTLSNRPEGGLRATVTLPILVTLR